MDTPAPEPKSAPSQPTPDRLTLILRGLVGIILAALLLTAGWLAYAYSASPASIRHPQHAHDHLRLQIITNGTPVNFAADQFQTAFNADICDATLTKEPIHFHDHLDQFVHLHWAGMTGGLLLKHYGWNFLTGPDRTLGYRFDQLPRLVRVPIHGQALPKPPTDAHYYVYTGDATSYQERAWSDFLKLDLRNFFGAPAPSAHAQRPLDHFIPTASAHSGPDSDLAKLNNVLGSVIIFAQKDRPTNQQIKARFNHLIPLPQSACAG